MMQDVEAEAASVWDAFPAVQPTQLEDTLDSEYEPARQGLHETAPKPEYAPAAQSRQLLDPTLL